MLGSTLRPSNKKSLKESFRKSLFSSSRIGIARKHIDNFNIQMRSERFLILTRLVSFPLQSPVYPSQSEPNWRFRIPVFYRFINLLHIPNRTVNIINHCRSCKEKIPGVVYNQGDPRNAGSSKQTHLATNEAPVISKCINCLNNSKID